ncbi:MAG: hypothetical protein L0211_13455 [Planctomycetaceae bacterium]|nr:hypothetical protein [Planctomycetaceae bacterium]
MLWTLAGLAIGAIGSLVVLRIINHDPTPRMTPEVFYAALERWKASAPPDYDIEIQVAGPQAAVYRVQVRGGQPTAAWRNGQPLAQHRTFGTWSVPGMFSTMARDVDVVERRAEGRAKPGEVELILKAQFDPQYSFPRRYQRIEWGSRRGSDAVAVTWEVTEFRVSGE